MVYLVADKMYDRNIFLRGIADQKRRAIDIPPGTVEVMDVGIFYIANYCLAALEFVPQKIKIPAQKLALMLRCRRRKLRALGNISGAEFKEGLATFAIDIGIAKLAGRRHLLGIFEHRAQQMCSRPLTGQQEYNV